jgi:hypothetical protein
MSLPTDITDAENHAGRDNAAHRACLAVPSMVVGMGPSGWRV